MKKYSILFLGLFLVFIAVFLIKNNKNNLLPLVAIANYGPHASLTASIQGFKEQMAAEGFVEQKTVQYDIRDASFDPALLSQMISSLYSKKPKVMLVMTTPVAQLAKGKIHDIPLIYDVVTDPVEAGLIKNPLKAEENISGSSDQQDLRAFLQFANRLLPKMKTVGLLYSTSEANDLALVKMMSKETAAMGFELLAIPVEQSREVALRVKQFKGRVDLIYVGTSGPVQPSLPAIAAAAHQMHLPVFNVESQAVRDGLALASFGVDYHAVGKNAGKLAAAVLKGQSIHQLSPLYPSPAMHHAIVNKKLADELGIHIPEDIELAR